MVTNKTFWEAYKQINKTFCDEIIRVVQPGDIIWVHDYHLMLLPKLLREKLQDVAIGFFLHIPFPSFEVFRLLPWRKEILDGILGADLIGFHTYDYVLHFLDSVRRLLGYEHSLGQIIVDNRVVKIDAFPIGIDFDYFAHAIHRVDVKKELTKIRKKIGGKKVILSIDRLDYTKGIPQRLEAFDLFLEKNPDYRGKVTFILVAVPSRTRVDHYIQLKQQVDELVGKINGKYGTLEWVPIWYMYRSLSFNSLAALYSVADIALVTPMRDGMNLIAKEYIATRCDDTGVLILSEMAGASKELGEAIIINPNNKEEIAQAIKQALTMPENEQKERNKIMRERLRRYNITRWANEFIDRLSYTKKLQQELMTKKLTPAIRKELLEDYSKSKKRLILLDYDGTLISFRDKPEKAQPDSELLKILETLGKNPKNEVILISGRSREILDKWFGNLNVSLVAEHGVWLKEQDKDWVMVEPLKNDWKEEIRSILELYVDRTPGTFIEEKDFSLVWHYRNTEPELALVRSNELKDTLFHLIANRDLEILEGSKIIEVKNMGINKGKAVLKWLTQANWDFILAIGDDWTDEDVFEILPDWAYSIKVGLGVSKARFNLSTFNEVRELLKEMEGYNKPRSEL